MPANNGQSRRNFLKMAAAFALIPVRKTRALLASAGWRAGLAINPLIDNVKAVCCYDDAMVPIKYATDFARQNEVINAVLIAANMDEMVKRLTNQSSPVTAWQIVFRKPSAKQWNQVRAAIKVSCANPLNMPRIAIVNKVCAELIARGVPAGNITVYDTLHNASGTGKYGDSQGNPVPGLPSGIVISTATLAGPEVPVGSGAMPCSPVIAQENAGAIDYLPDILVNIAANNGANAAGGELDLCMRNHAGTLKLSSPTAGELIDMNQSEAVIGEGSAEVPCRQQLCVVDSLWAVAGQTGAFSSAPCRIVMGMLAPIVDYFTAENIRKRFMGTAYDTSVTANWLNRFDIPVINLQWWNEFSPSTEVFRPHPQSAAGATIVTVSLRPSGSASSVKFFMRAKNAPVTIDIFTLSGRHVRGLTLPATTERTVTVTPYDLSMPRGAGHYSVRCRMGGEERYQVTEVSG